MSQAEPTALGSDEPLLDEVLASRLLNSDTRSCSVVSFIWRGLLLWCNAVLPCMCSIYKVYLFSCVLRTTQASESRLFSGKLID